MKRLIVALTICLCFASPAFAVDLSGQDKFNHFVLSALITTTVYHITDSKIVAVAVPLFLGVAKELYDSNAGGTGFSTDDLIADGLGVGLGFVYTVEF
jgi:putative lipoprotein